MLVYILKSAACLAILFVFYRLFLERENIHVFKRVYLLVALIIAPIIPAIVFTEYVEATPAASYPVIPQIEPTNEIINIPQALESDITDVAPILWTIYFLGVLFFGITFIKNLFQIFMRIRNNPKQKSVRFIQVLLQEKIPPHTFFNYIFLNRLKFESNEIPKEVLLHEETHAKQKHSWDVIFVELLQVVFWVNPFVYLTKKAIKLNHEFLADQAVLRSKIDKTTYQNTLLSYLSPDSEKKYQPTLANAINYSSTRLTLFGKSFSIGTSTFGQVKKRFTIMKKITSKKSVLLRTVLLLPLLASLLYGFSETKTVYQQLEINQEMATPEQVDEYNALAKKYNAMLGEETIRIKLSDVERLEYLYGLMSPNQRENAEPFPDFPPPPPMVEAPEAPEPTTAFREAGSDTPPPPPPPLTPDATDQSAVAATLTPPPPKSPLDHVREMVEKDAIFYYEGQKISADRAIQLLKENKSLNIDSRRSEAKRPMVKISKDPIKIEN